MLGTTSKLTRTEKENTEPMDNKSMMDDESMEDAPMEDMDQEKETHDINLEEEFNNPNTGKS
jgi:hypothetical protein